MQNQTITDFAKIMDRGLMVIPKNIRSRLDINRGSYVKIALKNNKIVIDSLIEQKKDDKTFYLKGIGIKKSKYSKKEGLKILYQTKNLLWSDKDDKFLAKGRKQIEQRLKKLNHL